MKIFVCVLVVCMFVVPLSLAGREVFAPPPVYEQTIDCYSASGAPFYHAEKVRTWSLRTQILVTHQDGKLDEVSGDCVVKGVR